MADKKIINLNKRRNKKLVKKIFMILRIPIVVLAVAAALFLSARLLGNVAVSNITDGVREIKTVFSRGEGYPYSLDSLNYRKVTNIGNNPLLLYDDSSIVLSSSAGEFFSANLGYGDSKVITQNGRALIFSNSSNEVVLQSKTEILGSVAEKGTVVAAGLADNGYFATSYSSDEYQSVLSVYNRHFEKVFQWNCSQERIADISFSGNGRNLVVAAVGAQNAEIYTRILVFNIGDNEPKVDKKYSGTLFLRVAYTDSNRIIAVGDNKAVVLAKDGEPVDELVYSQDSITAICIDDSGNTVVCYEEFGGSKTGIVRFSQSGKKTCSFAVEGIPDCIAAEGGRIAVVNGNEITVYTSNGNESRKTQTEHTVSDIFYCSGDIYAVENGALCKY